MIRVATKTVAINPPDEFYMLGYISPERALPALGVKDDLRAVLLLLETGRKRLLFAGLDVISISRERTSGIRRRLCETLGLADREVVLSAIHTHSGPCGLSVDAMGQAGVENHRYCEYVSERLADAAKGLEGQLTEAAAEIGVTAVRGYYDNRIDKNWAFDDSASVIRFVKKDKSLAAAMVNVNCHSTVLGVQNRYGSGDLLGRVRDSLAGEYGVTPYIFAGTIADISNRHYRQGNDFAELARVAQGVCTAIRSIENYRPLALETLAIREFSYRISYDNRKYAPGYRAQLEAVERALEGELTKDQRKLRLSEKSKLLAKLSMKEVDFTMDCGIYDLGGIRFVTFPGELTSVFGRKLREAGGKETLVIAYANGHHGYFLEQEAFGRCYESIATLAPRGETEKMIDQLGEML